MNRISLLLFKYITSNITEEEERELQEWTGVSEERRKFVEEVTSPEDLEKWQRLRSLVSGERPEADMQRRILELELESDAATKRGKKIKRLAFSLSAAAAVIAIVVTSVFLVNPGKGNNEENLMASIPDISIEEIHSGKAMAVLSSSLSKESVTLSDTTCSTPALMAISQSTMSTNKGNVETTASPGVETLNLTVPRGGEFKVVLEDSTVVWLNADSRLSYPKVFGDKERRVVVEGEAYFAVHKDPSRPFYVETGDQTVRVYGTTFNVRNYPDETFNALTLETGKIYVSAKGQSGGVTLSPGHQAVYDKDTGQLDMDVVDPAVVSSWRHGKFVFQDQPLKNIMRDLSRWYDFQYEFTDPSIGEIEFLGSIPRYEDFVKAVSIIEKCADLRFSTKGNKVIVARNHQ